MAEFCLECFNEIFNKELTKKDVSLSLFKELCEGCAECKRVVVSVRENKSFFNFFSD